MIIQGVNTPELLLPDMSFWSMINDQDRGKILSAYRLLCPSILYAEIYSDVLGACTRLKNEPEIVHIIPWQTLTKLELAGHSITDSGNFPIDKLKSVPNMSEDEKRDAELAPKLIEAFDESDEYRYETSSVLRNSENNRLIQFAKSPYQNLTWNQFMRRFKEIATGTVFEIIVPMAEDPTTNKNKVRAAIEKTLSQYVDFFLIDDFEKAFEFSSIMLEENFFRICKNIVIPMLLKSRSDGVELNETHLEKLQNEVDHNNVNNTYPYTYYTLQLYLALHIYQCENTYNKTIQSTDFEYLYYLFFSNVLFVSADKQHEKYITESGIFTSRRYGSFAYVPHINRDSQEHNKAMQYIKNGTRY